VLQRVEQGLLHVVEVAPAVVGRVDLDLHRQRAVERLDAPGREDRHDALPAALAADQGAEPCPRPTEVSQTE
jgi:hypothetical protein